MALQRLHRILIAAGILLAVIFAGYQVKAGEDVWAMVCAAIAIALTAYLVWFTKKSRGRS